jgi:hypothetical protein
MDILKAYQANAKRLCQTLEKEEHRPATKKGPVSNFDTRWKQVIKSASNAGSLF